MHRASSTRYRLCRLLTVVAVSVLCIPLGAGGASASPGPPEPITIGSEVLEVEVSADFPQVVQYTDLGTGASLAGSSEAIDTVLINEEEHSVSVDVDTQTGSHVDYVLEPAGLAGVRFRARLGVDDNVVTFEVTQLEDSAENPVRNLQIPDHDLVSVSSADPGAQVAVADLSPDRDVTGDEFIEVTEDTGIDDEPQGSAYALAHTDDLAAALETNSIYDDSDMAHRESNRFQRQARADGDDVRIGISSGQWTHRGQGSEHTEELPWARVAITSDANDDDRVDWQDGAIALRDIAVQPYGGEEVPGQVITHIPFNFASQATHPFLRTLDDAKRISLATDGLGQMALLKGYTSEGHDSANTDYGGNYNERAGGLEDLNHLLAEGDEWNAGFGVHINATEAYPEANSFSDDFVDQDDLGWSWLDQSYYIDQYHDLNSGHLASRIEQLNEETHDNLSMVYVDVYYEFGWLADQIQRELIANDFTVTTEWSYTFDRHSTWSHWASDEDYGGPDNKGINSEIIRMAHNTNRDVWNPHPLLGNAQVVEFEGWSQGTDWNAFVANVWENNLATKYLQHFEIMRWGDEAIQLDGDVRVEGTSEEDRVITAGGTTVLDGDTYLLPWDPTEPDRLYHHSAEGGTSSWTLTDDFADSEVLYQYELTDNGRDMVEELEVVDGEVSVSADAGQPYVLVADPDSTQVPGDPDWGAGTSVDDPGFNAGDLDAWNPVGDAQNDVTDDGHRIVSFGPDESAISQELGELPEGTYSVSAWLEVEPGKTRETTVSASVPGGTGDSNTIDRSGAHNYVGADEKHGTHFQKVRVLVDVPEGGARPTVSIGAEAGDAEVRVDDVRVVATEHSPGEDVVNEDFENVDQGWGPFVNGDAGGYSDARTHLSERNEPYTQAGWNDNQYDDVLDGTWSLKSHNEGSGLVYRTIPATVPLEPGRDYRVSFDYQSTRADAYAWVHGYDDAEDGQTVRGTEPLAEQLETERFEQTLSTGDCGPVWVGLERTGSDDASFVLDNFAVEDIGPSEETVACEE